jgi:hypothetical protein
MGLFDKLKSLVRGDAPVTYDDGTVFDPRIMKDFQAEIATWPVENARNAALVLRATLSGDKASFDEHFPNMTVGEMQVVMRTVERIVAAQKK